MNPADAGPEVVNALADELRERVAVRLVVSPERGLVLAGLLQLACRHPEVMGSTLEEARAIVEDVAEQLGPVARTVIAAGWTP